MNLQVINSTDGRPEYVLVPIGIYQHFKSEIDTAFSSADDDYVPFELIDYIDNPVALARIKANLTQKELAEKMDVTQAYISKLENQAKVSLKVMQKVNKSLKMVKKS